MPWPRLSCPHAGAASRGSTAALAGLDALELATPARSGLPTRAWAAAWPKLAALALGLLAWQAVVWSGWRPE